MARIVRFAQIELGRRRERSRADTHGRTPTTLWQRLSTTPWEPFALLIAFASMGFIAATLVPPSVFESMLRGPPRELELLRVTPANNVELTQCTDGLRYSCVVDGDTFWLDGAKIRIADIDTPEVGSPSCPEELTLGWAATARLTELLNEGPFQLVSADRNQDRYGRELRVVTRDGKSLGMVLVNEGLAHVWDGRKHSWCS